MSLCVFKTMNKPVFIDSIEYIDLFILIISCIKTRVVLGRSEFFFFFKKIRKSNLISIRNKLFEKKDILSLIKFNPLRPWF